MRKSSCLEIDLNLLEENFFKLKKITPNNFILPMVKANAYGNGIKEITFTLVVKCGVRKIGVATLGEAIEVLSFDFIPKEDFEIIVFSDSHLDDSSSHHYYQDSRLVPVIHRISDLEIFFSSHHFIHTSLNLKLNTGMNRLGVNFEELEPFLERIKNRGIDHLMTHFANSYSILKPNDRTHKQYDYFRDYHRQLKKIGVEIKNTSVSNSGAIEQNFGLDENFVRPGLMLYGPYSSSASNWNGSQISKLKTKILKTFMAKKGTPLGYGVNVLGEDSFVIVLALGYGDGILTFMSGVEIQINGQKGRIFGRINMDMLYVIFDPDVEGEFKENQIVEIWDHDNKKIVNISEQMRTHPYQVMTAISQRVPKIYLSK